MSKKVKFGVRLPAFPLDGTKGKAFRDQVMDYVAGLDEGAYDSLWVADHLVPWFTEIDITTDTYEAMTTLTYLAAAFPQYKVGSIVLSQSYRPPALLAKMGAVLQSLSGGRFILGIGAGWKEDEYLAYGYAYPDTVTRIKQLEEAVKIIRQMWTQPKATFHGEYYHVEEAICEPKPDPVPPILIGGGGRKYTLRIVAEQADWWNFPGGTVEHYAELLDVLRGHCETVGRDYDEIVKSWAIETVSVALTHEEALEIARRSPFYDPDVSIVGTPEEVYAQLKRFTDLGASYFQLRFADFPKNDVAKLFAKEVMPMFG
jgi:alkanesulfonate monooxygenase SsuD/methylene tetrahydromethanopterin reductase-like flavin-dependent oxidoreductase (luciferase family)